MRGIIRYINDEFKRLGNERGPLGWRRSLYRELSGRQIALIRCPFERFKSIWVTRKVKIEKTLGITLNRPHELLTDEFWCEHVYPLVPRMLESWKFENTKEHWEPLDIARHLLPQSFVVGTTVDVSRKGKPTGETKPELLSFTRVNELGAKLCDLAGVDSFIEPFNRNTRQENVDKGRDAKYDPTENQKRVIKTLLLRKYSEDYKLWNNVDQSC